MSNSFYFFLLKVCFIPRWNSFLFSVSIKQNIKLTDKKLLDSCKVKLVLFLTSYNQDFLGHLEKSSSNIYRLQKCNHDEERIDEMLCWSSLTPNWYQLCCIGWKLDLPWFILQQRQDCWPGSEGLIIQQNNQKSFILLML